jgi:transposase
LIKAIPADAAQEQAQAYGMRLMVVKHTEAKRGFVLLPRRWVVERSFAGSARFRRLARDYERLADTLAGMHFLAFVFVMLNKSEDTFGLVHNPALAQGFGDLP